MKLLTSTLSMIFLFMVTNTLLYFSNSWISGKWTILTIFITGLINVFVGIMITYNSLVSMNKRTVQKVLSDERN